MIGVFLTEKNGESRRTMKRPIEGMVIESMRPDFILWRCLHHGPVSSETLDAYPPDDAIPWARYRLRNIPLLDKLARTYGATAIVARDGDRVAGTLRFYSKTVALMRGAGGLCLQQDFPSGPADDFAKMGFPAPADLEDKTLLVHCLMTGSVRRGLGSRLVEGLVRWARENRWRHIEAHAFEDLPLVYEITGSAGLSFWKKLGFSMVDRRPHPDLRERSEFLDRLERQAAALGISPERARDRIVMRLDLA